MMWEKFQFPIRLLLKPGKLTPEEFEIMKTHTTKGYDIILRIFNDEGEEEYMQYSLADCKVSS